MLTLSGLGQLLTKSGTTTSTPTDFSRYMAPTTKIAAEIAPEAASTCPYGYVANQGMCVTQGCIDGLSPCIVLDANGQTCSYDTYLAYWHQSGVQACGPMTAVQPAAQVPVPAPQYVCSDSSVVDDPAKCPVPAAAAPQYVCADNSIVDDPSKCPTIAPATPAEGSSPGMQVTPSVDPAIAPPTAPTELPPIISPTVALGLGALGAFASAFVAYKTTGVTRLLASVGALGIGAYTAYRAVRDGSALVSGFGSAVFHPYGQEPRTIRLLG